MRDSETDMIYGRRGRTRMMDETRERLFAQTNLRNKIRVLNRIRLNKPLGTKDFYKLIITVQRLYDSFTNHTSDIYYIYGLIMLLISIILCNYIKLDRFITFYESITLQMSYTLQINYSLQFNYEKITFFFFCVCGIRPFSDRYINSQHIYSYFKASCYHLYIHPCMFL